MPLTPQQVAANREYARSQGVPTLPAWADNLPPMERAAVATAEQAKRARQYYAGHPEMRRAAQKKRKQAAEHAARLGPNRGI